MQFLFSPDFWAGWARIVLIDLLLAGDNALVIALAVRSLPPKEQFWGRIYGTAGAVVLRLLFVAIITYLLTIPLLRLVGGLLLVWIAVKLVRPNAGEEENVKTATSLRHAVYLIILADVVMSLDNVIAIAGAARNDMVLVVFGLLFSLPLVVWGSGFLARIMNRFPWVIWFGGGVLGWVAMHMIAEDPFVAERLGAASTPVHDVAPYILGAIITLLGWWFARRASRATEEGVATS